MGWRPNRLSALLPTSSCVVISLCLWPGETSPGILYANSPLSCSGQGGKADCFEYKHLVPGLRQLRVGKDGYQRCPAPAGAMHVTGVIEEGRVMPSHERLSGSTGRQRYGRAAADSWRGPIHRSR